MISVVVGVLDSAAGCYGRPVFSASVGLAVRSFTDEVNRVSEDNAMNKHPKDFVLFELASYDDSTGRFNIIEPPRRLVTATEVLSVV